MHGQRVPAEQLGLEAELREGLAILLERLALGGAQVQRKRKEQLLRRRTTAGHAEHEPLEEHALMRRVLVDQHDAVRGLEHHPRAPELHERRHLDGGRFIDGARAGVAANGRRAPRHGIVAAA